MSKFLKIVGGVLGVLLVLVGYVYYGYNHSPFPWKVTDPHDPRFEEDAFRFEDYYGRDGSKRLQEALRVMFPIGTPKAKVDKILYENQRKNVGGKKCGASMQTYDIEIRKPIEKNVVYYSFQPCFYPINIFNLQVYFDENNKVKEVSDHGVPLFNKNFYGDQ